jgi:uncharacterized hydrophobic protein (TIGR00271 family)
VSRSLSPAVIPGRATALYRLWRAALTRGVEHDQVVGRIREDSGWSPRYVFMTLMSAGIAVLGLLLSSPAVVIGAMLISPLMDPILGLGFSLALFDFREMRRSLFALLAGALAAVLFTALVVIASPLKAATAEILSRTRPNLFDLLVALFAALAGSFAIIRGRGATITGVAIATALMPPLAVVGYGLATWNLPVLLGSLGLFSTNLFTIALAAAIMARLYGFGGHLSQRQTWLQTAILVLVFVAMVVPLGVALSRIARDAVTVTEVRTYLSQRFGAQARVSQLNVDFESRPLLVRAVVIAPRAHGISKASLKAGLQARLGAPVSVQVDQVLLAAQANSLEAQRASLQQAQDAADSQAKAKSVADIVAVAAGAPVDTVVLDPDHQRAVAAARSLPGADLATYHALEAQAQAEVGDWSVQITPPLQPLPAIRFASGDAELDASAQAAVALCVWAAKRWNVSALDVPGLPKGPAPSRATLDQRRALAIAALLQAADLQAARRRAAECACASRPQG